jgi:hypothetical protein
MHTSDTQLFIAGLIFKMKYGAASIYENQHIMVIVVVSCCVMVCNLKTKKRQGEERIEDEDTRGERVDNDEREHLRLRVAVAPCSVGSLGESPPCDRCIACCCLGCLKNYSN